MRIWSTCSRSLSPSLAGVTSSSRSSSESSVAELADELGGGLLADPRHARDVVGRVALERLVVDHLVGPQPEPLVDPRDVVHDVFSTPGPGRHQADARGDELEHVEVDGDDRRLEVLARVELLRDRADDVVGLVALHLVDRDPEGLDDLADLRELVAQVVGHPHPGRLVLGVLLVTEGRARQVERDREVVRLEVLDAAQDDAREPEDAVDELALRRGQRRQREVSAVDEPVAVEQHQAFGGRASARNIGSGRMPRVYPADPPARTWRRLRRGSGGLQSRGRRPSLRIANSPRPASRSAPEMSTRADGPEPPDSTASRSSVGWRCAERSDVASDVAGGLAATAA